MKWKHPVCGDKRVKTSFLFWPRTIYNETRWLEIASWEQSYGFSCWHDVEWVDEQ